MTDEADWFKVEPKDGFALQLLQNTKPVSTAELAEWLMVCATNFVDNEGLKMLNPLKPYMAWQMARMMQLAELEVPK